MASPAAPQRVRDSKVYSDACTLLDTELYKQHAAFLDDSFVVDARHPYGCLTSSLKFGFRLPRIFLLLTEMQEKAKQIGKMDFRSSREAWDRRSVLDDP